MGIDRLKRLALLKLTVLVDAFLYENALQRCEIELFAHFAELYLQFPPQKRAGAVGTMAEQLAHRKEMRLVVLNHAAVGRNGHLAVGEGIKRIDGLVR